MRLLETHAPLKTECTNNPAGTKLGQRQTERGVTKISRRIFLARLAPPIVRPSV